MPRRKQSTEAQVREIRRKTRREFSAEEKIRIVLAVCCQVTQKPGEVGYPLSPYRPGQRHHRAVPKLILRTLELTFYHLLICFVDRLSRLPRSTVPPDVMRLYRENLALKVQLDALAAETTRVHGKRTRVSPRTRAAQVWAYLVTRGSLTVNTRTLDARRASASARAGEATG
jgi:hypothetical protein